MTIGSNSPNQDSPDVWGPSEVAPPRQVAPSNLPPAASPVRVAANSSSSAAIVLWLVAAACIGGVIVYQFLQGKNVRVPQDSRVRGPGDSKVLTGPPPGSSGDLPGGPAGVFIEAVPPDTSSPPPAFQVGTVPERKELESFVEGELKRMVPEGSEPPAPKQ